MRPFVFVEYDKGKPANELVSYLALNSKNRIQYNKNETVF